MKPIDGSPLAVAFLVACLSGCAGFTMLRVDGHSVVQEEWESARETVSSQAAFDLECPREELQLTLLDSTGTIPNAIGVTGCGTRLRYTRVPSSRTWALDAGSRTRRE